ncbi:MAG: hypothetical protein HYT07_01830 [Candidatus Levybacteria bacterium]|nr:hypothetical protein [Candidatus Levybacteria bacterium]
MAKHKTLEQKKLADIRREHFVYSLENKDQPSIHLPSAAKSQTAITVSPYSYIRQDILKTGILTLSIIGVQIVLFFLLKNRIIVFPNITY